MAEQKKSYPLMPVNAWWQLRKKFKQSIPGTVTGQYLAAALDMKETSARSNVLPSLRAFGIVDDQGATLDRARQWRDDAHYADVCKAIREEVYPSELLDAAPDPSSDRDAAFRWFSLNTGKGEAAVGKMVKIYSLLMEADTTEETATIAKTTGTKKRPQSEGPAKSLRDREGGKNDKSGQHGGSITNGPGLQINIQVHISSDATPDQIDRIFASMAAHIYRKE